MASACTSELEMADPSQADPFLQPPEDTGDDREEGAVENTVVSVHKEPHRGRAQATRKPMHAAGGSTHKDSRSGPGEAGFAPLAVRTSRIQGR